MDTYRFFAPDLTHHINPNTPIPLSEDEAHHAKSVLRLTAGDAVVVFDGKGAWASGNLFEDWGGIKGRGGGKPRGLAVTLTSGVTIDPPPPIALTLATAIPKGDRAEWLVEQASQLNVTQILWLDTDRGVAKIKDTHKLEKFRRIALESAKQCGRNHLLHIDLSPPLEKILTHSPDLLLWLEPRDGGATVPTALTNNPAKKITALIGPEGGWSPKEFALLESAANASPPKLTRIRLTPTILRIETAAAALAALITTTS